MINTLVALGFIVSSLNAIPTPTPPNDLIITVNEYRAEHNLSVLVPIETLQVSSQAKSQDLADLNYFTHDRPNGDKFNKDILDKKLFYIGEILARCQDSDKEALKDWLKSPPHYESIIGDWKYIGASTVYDRDLGCQIRTVHFAR